MKKTYPSIFNDVIGPVMRGPSSSHVAAAARIGELLRQAVKGNPDRVICDFDVNGSLAESHDGHGTDMGFICGVLGIPLTDPRVDRYWDLAKEQNVDFEFRILDYGAKHPNHYRVKVESGNQTFYMDAISTGGGMIEVLSINHLEVSMLGDYYETCFITKNAIYEDDAAAQCKKTSEHFEQVRISSNKDEYLIEFKTSGPLNQEQKDSLQSYFQANQVIVFEPILPTMASMTDTLPFHTVLEMEEYNADKNLELWQLAALYESKRGNSDIDTVLKHMNEIVDIMQGAINNGLQIKEYKDRILGSQAYRMSQEENKARIVPGDVMNTVIQYITACMEAKSGMDVIVAAPTCGSCGLLSGTVLGAAKAMNKTREEVVQAMLAAGLIGVFFAGQATFAAEVGGCQMECGAGSGMAAAAITQLMHGSAKECIHAASFALQGLTGLACDPVANRVEVPCLNKNIVGGMNAINSANVILSGFDHVLPLNEVIDAMYDIGTSLPISLRCTGGGLGKTATSMYIRKRLEEIKK